MSEESDAGDPVMCYDDSYPQRVKHAEGSNARLKKDFPVWLEDPINVKFSQDMGILDLPNSLGEYGSPHLEVKNRVDIPSATCNFWQK